MSNDTNPGTNSGVYHSLSSPAIGDKCESSPSSKRKDARANGNSSHLRVVCSKGDENQPLYTDTHSASSDFEKKSLVSSSDSFIKRYAKSFTLSNEAALHALKPENGSLHQSASTQCATTFLRTPTGRGGSPATLPRFLFPTLTWTPSSKFLVQSTSKRTLEASLNSGEKADEDASPRSYAPSISPLKNTLNLSQTTKDFFKTAITSTLIGVSAMEESAIDEQLRPRRQSRAKTHSPTFVDVSGFSTSLPSLTTAMNAATPIPRLPTTRRESNTRAGQQGSSKGKHRKALSALDAPRTPATLDQAGYAHGSVEVSQTGLLTTSESHSNSPKHTKNVDYSDYHQSDSNSTVRKENKKSGDTCTGDRVRGHAVTFFETQQVFSISDLSLGSRSEDCSVAQRQASSCEESTAPNAVSESAASSLSNFERTDHDHDYLTRRYFLLRLAEALFTYGAPSYRIDYLLKSTSQMLQMSATFATLPSFILMSFADVRKRATETFLLPLQTGCDFDKLFMVCRLCAMLGQKKRTLEEGGQILEDLLQRPSRYPEALRIGGAILTSTLISSLGFGGSWYDMGAAMLMSFGGQIVMLVFSGREATRYIAEPVTAFFVGFATVPIKRAYGPRVCYPSVILAGILGNLPGMMLCTALVELTSGNVISGTTRLMAGLVHSLVLAFGLSVGYRTWGWFIDHTTYQPQRDFFTCTNEYAVRAKSYWLPLYIFLVPCMGLGLCLNMRAAPSQVPIMIGTSCLAYWVNVLLKPYDLTAEFVSIFTAFIVSLTANIYSRITGSPGIGPLLNGIILLVPGSMGVRSSLKLIDKADFGNGTVFAFEVILTALSLSLGILASRVVPPVESYFFAERLWAIDSVEGCIGYMRDRVVAPIGRSSHGAKRKIYQRLQNLKFKPSEWRPRRSRFSAKIAGGGRHSGQQIGSQDVGLDEQQIKKTLTCKAPTTASPWYGASKTVKQLDFETSGSCAASSPNPAKISN